MKIYKMKKQAYSKIGLAIGTLLLVPVVVYTVFQFVQRSKEEELIRSIYNEQLESLLFSVNQHCWDAIQAISSELLSLIPPEKYIPPQFDTSLKKLLKNIHFGTAFLSVEWPHSLLLFLLLEPPRFRKPCKKIHIKFVGYFKKTKKNWRNVSGEPQKDTFNRIPLLGAILKRF